MAVDFTRYQVPGVYVQDTSDPIVTGGGLPPSLLCIVGPARGYQIATETLIVFEDEGAALRQRGVITEGQVGPPAITAPVVTKLDGTPLEEDTDYELSTEAGLTPGTAVTYVTVVEASTELADGEAVIVTYNFINHLYHTPRRIDSFQRAIELYGRPLLLEVDDGPSESHVDSPLTLGIQLAFQNEASEVLALALDPTDGDIRAQFEAAYEKIRADYRANIIVPVFQDNLSVGGGTVAALAQTLAQDLRAHCNLASNEGYMRTGVFGLPANYDDGDIPAETLALNLASKRVALVYPHRMQMFSTAVNQSIEVAGCYIAAALGGRLSQLPVNTGLTRQIVAGFSGINAAIRAEMTLSFKNELSGNGVLVLESDRVGRLLVRHGVTTDNTSLTNREISMVRINDAVHVGMQVGVENSGLIGAPIDDEMQIRVQGVVQTTLEQMRLAETIVDWAGLTVRQQSIDPSVIEVQFAYRPAVPLNYIVISYSVNLNTGDVNTGPLDQ